MGHLKFQTCQQYARVYTIARFHSVTHSCKVINQSVQRYTFYDIRNDFPVAERETGVCGRANWRKRRIITSKTDILADECAVHMPGKKRRTVAIVCMACGNDSNIFRHCYVPRAALNTTRSIRSCVTIHIAVAL